MTQKITLKDGTIIEINGEADVEIGDGVIKINSRHAVSYVPYPIYPPTTVPSWPYVWPLVTSGVAPLTVGEGVAPLTVGIVREA